LSFARNRHITLGLLTCSAGVSVDADNSKDALAVLLELQLAAACNSGVGLRDAQPSICLLLPLQANVRNYYMQFTEGPNAEGGGMDPHQPDMMHMRNSMGPRDMPPRMGMGPGGPGMGPPGMGPGGMRPPPFMGGPGMGPPRGETHSS
jgi:hypothetical protein